MKSLKYFIRIALTIIGGILVTAFNVHAATRVTGFELALKMHLDIINSLFALATASITIVYIYFQIKKIRTELKIKQRNKDKA